MFAYLATPYGHPSEIVMEDRFRLVTKAALHLNNRGRMVFSPITHNHPIEKQMTLAQRKAFPWQDFDDVMLKMADALILLQADGWYFSVGVRHEITLAGEIGLPIYTMAPFNFAITMQFHGALIDQMDEKERQRLVHKTYADVYTQP